MRTKGYYHFETKDLTKLGLYQLIGSLITQKMINYNDDEKKKKKDLALQAFPGNDDVDINDEQLELLSRKFKRLFIKMRGDVLRVPKQERKDVIKCFKCNKLDTSWEPVIS